jgi:hypothetical protein
MRPDELLALDHEELLDAVLVEQLLGPLGGDPRRHRDELRVMSAETGWSRFLAKRMSRAVRMPHGAVAVDDRHAADACSRITWRGPPQGQARGPPSPDP